MEIDFRLMDLNSEDELGSDVEFEKTEDIFKEIILWNIKLSKKKLN